MPFPVGSAVAIVNLRKHGQVIEIIHGISGGRLRVAVRTYLAGMPAVTCAARDDRNPGVTIAYF